MAALETNPVTMAHFAKRLLSRKNGESDRFCSACHTFASNDGEVGAIASQVLSYEVPSWHFSIVRDGVRNALMTRHCVATFGQERGYWRLALDLRAALRGLGSGVRKERATLRPMAFLKAAEARGPRPDTKRTTAHAQRCVPKGKRGERRRRWRTEQPPERPGRQRNTHLEPPNFYGASITAPALSKLLAASP